MSFSATYFVITLPKKIPKNIAFNRLEQVVQKASALLHPGVGNRIDSPSSKISAASSSSTARHSPNLTLELSNGGSHHHPHHSTSSSLESKAMHVVRVKIDSPDVKKRVDFDFKEDKKDGAGQLVDISERFISELKTKLASSDNQSATGASVIGAGGGDSTSSAGGLSTGGGSVGSLGVAKASTVIYKISSKEDYQITFVVDSYSKCDKVMDYLTKRGVGIRFGNVHLAPCVLSYRAPDFHGLFTDNKALSLEKKMQEGKTVRHALDPSIVPIAPEDSAAEDVAETLSSMDTGAIDMGLVGDRVYEDIRGGSLLTIDYILLTVLASLLAGVALAADNTVVIVASMLVSPLMGPILAITFGLKLRMFRDLLLPAVFAEIIALVICILCGFVVGIIFSPWGDRLNWPNLEMEGRGHINGLFIGLGIAIPSGLGVAWGMISNNVASLVGVAISASLLPPAVNCGMCWAYAAFGERLVLPSSGGIKPSVDARYFIRLGAISLGLTMLNIGCIILVAYLVFYIKIKSNYPGKAPYFKWLNVDATKTVKRRGSFSVSRNKKKSTKTNEIVDQKSERHDATAGATSPQMNYTSNLLTIRALFSHRISATIAASDLRTDVREKRKSQLPLISNNALVVMEHDDE